MRLPVAMMALVLSLPAMAAGPAPAPVPGTPDASLSPHCPRTTSYLAEKSSLYRGQPPAPKKLTELPPAITYMAVLRRIGGCEAPLTMVDYRNPRRR